MVVSELIEHADDDKNEFIHQARWAIMISYTFLPNYV